MPRRSVSIKRPLTSYAKVQVWLGSLVRNRRFQLRRPRVRSLRFVDVGCGRNPHEGLINVDFEWHPGIDVCWDVTRGLPFDTGTITGVFSEHCLEHFPRETGFRLLTEIHRVLAPNGTVRIVVPDAERYLRTYARQRDGDASVSFPFQPTEMQDPLWTPLASVNRVYYQDRESPFGHRMMYDFQTIERTLQRIGFTYITREAFRRGRESQLLVDSEARAVESLYVEASKATGMHR